MAPPTPPAPVAFVIPVHQGERYLAEAIESVLVQSRPPAEVIVVDDGSTDASAAIASSFGERVTVLRRRKSGVAAARNAGIARAAQPYVAFLDADDIAPHERVAAQLAAFQGPQPLDIAFGQMEQFVSPDLPTELAQSLRCDSRPQPSPLPSCFMAPRDVCARLGPMREDLESAFVDWYMRALDLGLKIAFVDALVARRRIHGANQSFRNDSLRREYIRVIKSSLDRRRRAGA